MVIQQIYIRCRDDARRGQMVVVFALSIAVFVGALALGVDLSYVRTEAENAQRAANAAALAGVIFMPNYQSQATYRAQEEATKNGFTDGQNSTSITVSPVPPYSYRLRVTISELVPIFFGHLFGLGNVRISRSATAEYLPPLQMGSPDYVLGFPRFPSYLTYDGILDKTRSPQNFYLSQNGPYTYKEQGDPFDPFFESISGQGYGSGISGSNPCTSSATPPDATAAQDCPDKTSLVLNKNAEGGKNFAGYKYVISLPTGVSTVVVKLFDPFNSTNYNYLAYCWDRGFKGATSPVEGYIAWYKNTYGAAGSGDSYCSSTHTAATKQALFDITPTDTSTSHRCLLGEQNGGCRNEQTDEALLTNFLSSGITSLPDTKLQFSLTGPTQSLLDPTLSTKDGVILPSDLPPASRNCPTENCVVAKPFAAGDDPATGSCNTTACPASSVAFKFVNYAILHGSTTSPTYYELTVKSVVNSDNTYGEGNNAYGIAVCGAGDQTYTNPYNPGDGPLWASGNYVTSDPLSTDPTTFDTYHGWNPAACASPNPSSCPTNPRLAAPGQCVQIYAQGHMPLYNYIGAGSSIIPLGYIPPDYAGRTIDVKLFDPGDVGQSSATASATFGNLAPTDSSAGTRDDGTAGSALINTMEILTPAGDLQDIAPNHVDGHLNSTQQTSLGYDVTAAPDYGPSNYKTDSGVYTHELASQPLSVGNGTRTYNGSLVTEKITIPNSYPQMVSGGPNPAFGAYWKVLYRLGGDSTDVTVWSLSVDGSAVHLVNP